MRAGSLVVAFILLSSGAARAQTASGPPSTTSPVAVPPSSPPVPPPANDPTRAAYDAAFQDMLAGQFALAATGFDGVAAQSQDPELAAAARELARLARSFDEKHVRLTTAEQDVLTGAAGAAAEDRDQGRTQFVVWTTFYSIYAGIVLDADLGVSDAKAGVLIDMGTTAAGLIGSIYGTRGKKMTGAMGDAYSLGMLEGIGNALLLIRPAWPSASAKEWVTTALVSGGVGGVVGLEYGDHVAPTRGQVSFAETMSLMGVASVWLGYGVVQPGDISSNSALLMSAGALDVGLGAGLYLGRDLDWSPSRARLVQLGAIVGGVFGGGLGYLITSGNSSGDTNTRIMTGAALVGAWGGLALGTHLTAGMRPDRRYLKNVTTVAPMVTPHGGAGVSLMGQF